MTRKTALEYIKADFATHGKDSGISSRIYLENRLSYQSFQKAAAEGLKLYNSLNNEQADNRTTGA